MADALQQGGLRMADVAAIGVTNQRETTAIWERATGRPVAPAIVWQDMRVAGEIPGLARDPGEDFFRSRTGLPLSTYFSSLKIRWLLENIPGLRVRAENGDVLFGTMDTFLVWNLTGGPNGGVHVTDVTNASRTQLMNLQTLNWDADLLRAFRIPAQILPRIASSSEVYGRVPDGPPVAGILGDQQPALVPQPCCARGEAKNTYGPCCLLFLNT